MKPRVLLGILNWGLGHAVRCVPVVSELLNQGAEVIICGNGSSLALLKREFPALKAIEIPVPEIRYNSQGFTLLAGIAIVWRIIFSFFVERKAVLNIAKQYGITHIISDHKFGLRTGKLPTAIVCHQLSLKLPKKIKFLEKPANYLNQKLLQAFNEIWILGVLSFQTLQVLNTWRISEEKTCQVAVICSGPEPWRTEFERKALLQLKNTSIKFILVRGTSKQTEIELPNAINLATRAEILDIISKAEFVVSLAGYTSICDYYNAQTKALLIPTPNQPEQEYLAERQKKFGYFQVSSFAEMNIPEAYEKRNELKQFPKSNSENLLQKTIYSFLYTAQNQSVSSLNLS